MTARCRWGALALVLAAGCGRSPAHPPPPTGAPTALPVPTAKETADRTPITFVAPRTGDKYVYLTKQRRNRKIYALRADAEKGEYFGANTGRSSFVNPHIVFYGSGGKQLTADAPTGIVLEREKTVLMSGGVSARSQDGVHLVSDAMTYDDASETIHARGDVVMDSPDGSQLRGTTLDWNLHSGAIDVAGAH